MEGVSCPARIPTGNERTERADRGRKRKLPVAAEGAAIADFWCVHVQEHLTAWRCIVPGGDAEKRAVAPSGKPAARSRRANGLAARLWRRARQANCRCHGQAGRDLGNMQLTWSRTACE